MALGLKAQMAGSINTALTDQVNSITCHHSHIVECWGVVNENNTNQLNNAVMEKSILKFGKLICLILEIYNSKAFVLNI